jgi:lysophospholipase L1-like esterase
VQNTCGRGRGGLAGRRGAGRPGGRLDRELGGERRLSRWAGHQLPDLAPDCSPERRRQAGAREVLERDRPVSAGHRRRPYREAGDGRASRGDRPGDRPRAHLRRARRDHRAAGPSVIHLDGVATTYISGDGDFTAAAAIPSPKTSTSRFFLDEVDVNAAGLPSVVVTLGDSITDGYRSKVDGNHRWPDRLAERLAARASAAPVGVVNAGVSGNRILHDHPEDLFGPSALERLDRDVLSVPGVKWVVLMEGINDIGHSTSADLPDQDVSANEIIAGMKQIIARVHEHGAKIYGATLTPYEGTVFHGYYQPDGEAKREAVNAWIRNGGYFDAVIDFDAAVRDPDHPTRIRPEFDVDDHLHPNDAGYRIMGEAVDLNLFE